MINTSAKRPQVDPPNTAPAAGSRLTALQILRQEEARYPQLFNCREIMRHEQRALVPFFHRYPNVDMDHFATVIVGRDDPATWALTTSNLAACVAVCARGRNQRGETVLYLAHHVNLNTAAIDHALKELMIKGCNPRDVSVYIVGGEQNEDGHDREEELQFLNDLRGYPEVKGLKLEIRPTDSEADPPGTAVVLTADRLFYCRSDNLSMGGRDISHGSELGEVTDDEFDAIAALREGRIVGLAVNSQMPEEEQK